MKPYELVAKLVHATGKPTLQVATEMHSAGFQGTLHKYINGHVASPSRSTAERIAKYFDIEVDAIYNSAVAARVARERGLSSGHKATTLHAREPATIKYSVAPRRGLAVKLEARIARLDDDQLAALERIITAYLDGVAPESGSAKRAG